MINVSTNPTAYGGMQVSSLASSEIVDFLEMDNFNLTANNQTSVPFMENGNKKKKQGLDVNRRKKNSFRQAWVEFSNNTTLHGLRYIAEADSFLLRR